MFGLTKFMAHQEQYPLARAVESLAHAIEAQTEWLRANLNSATKRDLKDTEARLLKAFGERVDPAEVAKLSDAAETLDTAVKAQQPPISG